MKTYTIETAYLTLIDAQIEVLKYTDGQMALEATALQHDPDEDDSTVSEILTTNLIGYGHVAEPGHAYIKDYDLYVGLPAVRRSWSGEDHQPSQLPVRTIRIRRVPHSEG